MTKKEASNKNVVGKVVAMTNVEPTDAANKQGVVLKAVHIYFNEIQIPQIIFCGDALSWNVRDILHIKRLLTREYKKYLRDYRQGVKVKEVQQ